MGFFNFFETIFFISLGITFVLIILLAYHFKQRVHTLEEKSDTMYEIIQNMLKEVTSVRSSVLSMQQQLYSSASQFIPFSNEQKPQTIIEEPINIHVIKEEYIQNTKTVDDEDDEGSTDSEYDSDDSSQDDNDNDDNDDDEDDDVSVIDINIKEEINKIVVSDDEDDKVKIINVDLTTCNETNNEIKDSEDFSEIIINVDSHEDNTVNITLDEIVEEKTYNDLNNETNLISESQKKEDNMEIYKKMNIQTLKSIVISKGLSNDVSKMKKQDLLKLLE